MFDTPPPLIFDEDILITASREEVSEDKSSDSATVIDRAQVERLGESRVVPLLRLLPSVALAETGPAGTQAQVRIRGAEASHTLLFIDGIKANDPAAGNEARFELLSAELGDLVEQVRGPQSALWGSEAIGGVIALRSGGPGRDRNSAFTASLEGGSADFVHGAARYSMKGDGHALTFALGGQRSGGIDSFGGDGERDGYRNLAGRFAGSFELTPTLTASASGFAIDANSEFDGFDPFTFLRADTLDETDNRLGAGRIALRYANGALSLDGHAGLLGSSNINRLDEDEINRTSAERFSTGVQGSYRLQAGRTDHRLTLAVEHESENFRADDVAFGGFTRQEQDRARTAFIAEWRMGVSDRLSLDAALRHDDFNRFEDATSFSTGARLALGDHAALTANYGEGIAQPSFFDLYGFFPGSFVGNPDLRPESSSGYDIGIGYERYGWGGSLTWFDQELEDEIVDVFDPVTFVSTTENGTGDSRRSGIEAEIFASLSPAARISANYSYLDAEEPEAPDGSRLRETRRPRHRGAIILDGSSGRWTYGGSLAIVGARFDTDFDRFPAERVKLGTYAVASARIAFAVSDRVELSLRTSNLFDADYQDVVGYNTQGRAIYVGIRLRP